MGVHTVLIVDDDADIRDAMKEMLELEGYGTAAAADGLEALGTIRAGLTPSAILLDLMMPVMTGEELFQVLPPSMRRRCVVMTAGPAKILGDGVPTLRKPFEMDGLLDTIKQVCAR